LAHEVIYHGVAAAEHTDEEKKEGEKKDKLDATRPKVTPEWGTKCTFLDTEMGKKLLEKMGIKEPPKPPKQEPKK